MRFDVNVGVQAQNDMRARPAGAQAGADAEHPAASVTSHGTIVCDVVGVSAGNLLVDVTEDAGERSSATKRVAVQSDGGLMYLPNQGTLNEEEAELASLLAPGLLGTDRAVGDSWTFRLSSPNYSATKTFRLTQIVSQERVSLSFDESFTRTGAEAATGTVTGTVVYDPAGLVPLDAKIDRLTRSEDAGTYTSRKLALDFTLEEDTRAKH